MSPFESYLPLSWSNAAGDIFSFFFPPFGSSRRKSRTFLQSSQVDPLTCQVPSTAALSTKFCIFPDVWWVVFDRPDLETGLFFCCVRVASDFRVVRPPLAPAPVGCKFDSRHHLQEILVLLKLLFLHSALRASSCCKRRRLKGAWFAVLSLCDVRLLRGH